MDGTIAKVALVTERPEAPDVAQQLLLGEHPPRLGRERAQQRVLLAGELDLALAGANLAGGGVDEQVADAARAEPAGIATAEDRADPGEDLAVVERLSDVIVGSLGEAAEPVGRRAAPAQDDHRQERVVAAGCAVGGADL